MTGNDTYQDIKSRLDLLTIITQETGFTIPKGKKHLSECPFCGGHECFSIHKTKQTYKCFQCDANGDVFTFLEDYFKIEKSEALKKASERAGVVIPSKGPAKPKDSTGLNLTFKESIFIAAAQYYHANMSLNGGRDYLIEKRGHKEDILKQFMVGWTDGRLVEHLRSKGFSDEHIKASWLGKEFERDGVMHLIDRYRKGWAIFPHFIKHKVVHFTHKDPEKKEGTDFQLPSDYRDKDWRFYNQDALGKFSEVIVVEGENDLLSALDVGIQNVIGTIGQPAEYQIKALKTYCAQKHVYLWLDNDEDPEKPLTKGKGFIRQVCRELSDSQNVRIIVYDDIHKDPDEYIRTFAQTPGADCRKEIRRLQNEALDYISWEIREISKIETIEKRINALKERGIFARISGMMETEKVVFVEKLTLQLGLPVSVTEEQLDVNQDLKRELSAYFQRVPKKDADPNEVAFKIFRHFNRDGRFFRDSAAEVYLLLHHSLYSIGNNRPFNALIKRHTNLLPTKEPGRSVWESLASEAYNMGMLIDLVSWIATDRQTDTIFVNLNSRENTILKISKEGVEEIPNGINKEGRLLKSSNKILPVNYLPDCDIKDGMQALKELILDRLTCEEKLRYKIILWLFSAFLLDFCPYMALMKFSGATASGKTTAAKLISVLVYGAEDLGDPTGSAAYSVSSQNPLLVIDNLESDDITKQMAKFLLQSATKGAKEKHAHGTNSGTVQEKPRSLVLITAIEPFTKAEHINRTYDIEFSHKYKKDDFIEDEVLRELIKKRDLIISSMLKFVSKEVLPDLQKRKDYITILKKEHKNHSKNRTDEYLALLMLMLEKILKYIPYYDENHILWGEETGEKEIRNHWIEYQNQKAKETETTSNHIIKLLDGMVREYLMRMKDSKAEWDDEYQAEVFTYTHPEYGIEMVKTKPEVITTGNEQYSRSHVDFVAMSSEIVQAFDRYCKNNGLQNPYKSEAVFGSRLRNDTPLLEKSGWQLICKDGTPWNQEKSPYFRIVEGRRFRKFRKTIIR